MIEGFFHGFLSFPKNPPPKKIFNRNPENFSGTPDMPDIMGLTIFCSAASVVELFFGLQYKKAHLKPISFLLKPIAKSYRERIVTTRYYSCLLYTSDAADDTR
jgi:hypothetical protein